MPFAPLPDSDIEPLVRAALAEDLGPKGYDSGDITTHAVIPAARQWQAAFVARKPGVIAGLAFARLAFHLLDRSLAFETKISDGALAAPGTVLATVKGSARSILKGERTALNFLCHLSGIATAAHNLVEAVRPHKARISCTRKTTPGLRIAEKYAVRAGGGRNHRFGLYDAVLIKDNHIAASGGLREAVLAARKAVGPNIKVELEVDSLDQLTQALDLPLDAVLLDNMDPATLAKAVQMVGTRFETEASGGITLDTVRAVAASGVDIISVGWITHSAPILDIGLDEV